jgi:hypothetical protein
MKFKFLNTVFAGLLLTTSCLVSVANAGLINTLFFGADTGLAAVKSDILGSDARFNHVNSSYADARQVSNLAYLQSFDSILFWTNYNAASQNYDLLKQYVDTGGLVVLGTFNSLFNSGTGINLPGYNPITQSSGAYSSVSLGVFDNTSQLFAGVNTLSSTEYNSDGLGVDTGATLVGSWNNGDPLVAINANKNVIGVSLFPRVAQYGHASGDYRTLFANALAYSPSPVPEPSTLAIFALGMIGLASRRFKKKS